MKSLKLLFLSISATDRVTNQLKSCKHHMFVHNQLKNSHMFSARFRTYNSSLRQSDLVLQYPKLNLISMIRFYLHEHEVHVVATPLPNKKTKLKISKVHRSDLINVCYVCL